MSKIFFKLADGDFFQDWHETNLISTNNNWNNVPSIQGFLGGGLASSGRNPSTIFGDGTTPTLNVIANQTATTITNGGIAEFQLADAVVALQGSGTAQAPHLVLYLDASGRENLHFSVDLRDIDVNDNAIQQVAVQYRVGDSGAWKNVPDGYVPDASNGPGDATRVTHLELDLPEEINNQSQVEIRIMTADAAGSDEWIGVDNIKVTSHAMPPDVAAPELASSSPADGDFAVVPDANLTLNFSELIQAGSGSITISDGAGDVRVIDVGDAGQVSVSGQSLTINPADPLKMGATYHVSIDAGAVHDKAGNAYAGTGENPIDFMTMAELTRVFEIQGAAHTSAYQGKQVITRGVVTAIDTTDAKGFYIQDMEGDGDDATSDAVFVFSSFGTTQVKVGDLVQIQGTVNEFASNPSNLSNTEITNLKGPITVISSGNTIASTVIGDGGRLPPTEAFDSDNFGVFNPDHDGVDFYESLEGMLVTVKNAQVIDGTFDSGTWAVADQGAHATGMNDRGGITHGADDGNPERIMLYADSGVASGLDTIFETGDLLGDVTGVLGYSRGNYQVNMTAAPGVQSHLPISREATLLAGDDAAHLTVGAYNVHNLNPTDGQAKFDLLGHDIVDNLGAPDILGLEEVQDNNGPGKGELSADVTIGMLLDAIEAAGGPRYAYAQLDPAKEGANGGDTNGNIRNVILYDPTRVSYVEGTLQKLQDTSPGNGDSFSGQRHPLTADFMFHGENVSFIGIHNYSRLGSDELFSANQPPFISGDARRTDQTSAVRDYVAQLKAANPDAHIVVGGDFNGFQFETSLTQLEGNGGLTNLSWKLEESDRYSSTYAGNDEQIDHLLVSSHLAGDAEFDIVHINTNLPYDDGASDHDPVLARLLINTAPVALLDAGFGLDEDSVFAVDAANGVLANDSDANQDALGVQLVTGPAHGTLTLNADGSFEYRADANYNGEDSFSYVASDGFGGTSAVTSVDLAVAAVNDAPAAANDSAVVTEDGSVLIDVLVNDEDVDLDALSIVLDDLHSAKGATLAIENGKVRYIADADSFDLLLPGQSLTDTFTYTADDGHGGRSEAVTVSITVNEAGDGQLLSGTNKSDTFVDGAGRDAAYDGGNGDDIVLGKDGADLLNGGNGSDVLFGGAGIDMLLGDNGTDVLVGGAGDDILNGGNGADVFVITSDAGRDTLVDFRPGLDSIRVGYAGAENATDLDAWLKGNHNGSGFSFADVDLDGNGAADAVAVTGGSLGADTVVLNDWTVAELVAQRFLSADHRVLGDWLL